MPRGLGLCGGRPGLFPGGRGHIGHRLRLRLARGRRFFPGRGCIRRRQSAALHQRLELGARQLFPFHQGTGHRVQLLHMLGKNAARRLIGFIQHITNLAVDFSRHLLGIPAARAEIAPKESFVRV